MKFSLHKYFFLALIVATSGFSFAQKKSEIFSALKEKPELIGGFSSKYSLVKGKPNKIAGLYIGGAFDDRLKLWAGIYWMRDPIEDWIRDERFLTANPPVYKYKIEGRMTYLSLGLETRILHGEKWKVTVPVQLGIGGVKKKWYHTSSGALYQKEKTAVLPIEAGVYGEYLIIEWLGLGAGLGTRLALGKETIAPYSGPYANLGLVVLLGVLYKKLPKDWQVITFSSYLPRTLPTDNQQSRVYYLSQPF
jgi:hypothetical protein